MKPPFYSSSRLRRVRLAAAGALIAAIPALWSSSACNLFRTDECEDVPCVEVCGGDVVTVGCVGCPEGLLDGRTIRCNKTCDELVEPDIFETCDHCPEGSFDADGEENVQVGCVARCGDAALALICSPSQFCPTGTFDRMLCDLECKTKKSFCVDACGGDILDVRCDPCSIDGLIDRDTCSDAGADGG